MRSPATEHGRDRPRQDAQIRQQRLASDVLQLFLRAIGIVNTTATTDGPRVIPGFNDMNTGAASEPS
jgi:hypothetical protein